MHLYSPCTYTYCIIQVLYIHNTHTAFIQLLYAYTYWFHTALVLTQYTYCIHTALVLTHTDFIQLLCLHILQTYSPCTYKYGRHTWTLDSGHMLYRSFLLHKYNSFNTHTAYIQSFYIHALTYDINRPLACTFWMMLKALSHMHIRHKYRPISHTSAYTQAFHLPRL